ncbi:unnamed protein product [Eruca vesicaria subsp. sativa]|uniref:GED domain-containing protein n=1 Tax=Eruca vesicaria subsp. sativa TaxID=29727 RepID=A0ABC8LL03_ERUVS|nr:unnamed protein product [Eruca vesicaria subsp. sativa]
MITRCLPEIVQNIDEKLDKNILELNKLPTVINSPSEALMTLMNIICSVKESLHRLLIQGDVSEYQDDHLNMPSSTRLADMLRKFSDDLQAQPQATTEFLMDEIKIQHFIKRACGRLLSMIKEQSVSRVTEIVEMEKLTDYTCNKEYTNVYTHYIAAQGSFISAAVNTYKISFDLTGFGTVPTTHLRKYPVELLHQAFDIKMRITAYWAIVVRRIVDSTALYLQFTLKNFINSQFQKEIVAELVNHRGVGDVEKMLEESTAVASKREKLKNSIRLLKEAKDAVSAIVDHSS